MRCLSIEMKFMGAEYGKRYQMERSSLDRDRIATWCREAMIGAECYQLNIYKGLQTCT